MKNAMKLHLNSLYGKMVSKLADDEEKFVRKCIKHEKDEHSKNCTITITETKGLYVDINTYKLDDYRVATAVCNILDNVRYVERGGKTIDRSSFHSVFYPDLLYSDTDSCFYQNDILANIKSEIEQYYAIEKETGNREVAEAILDILGIIGKYIVCPKEKPNND